MEITSMVGASNGEAAAAARDAEILGKPQRIGPLELAQVGQDVWDTINAIRKPMGLGPATDIPGYSLTMAKHPEMFRRQMEMGTALFAGTLPARERELLILRIAWLIGAPFEWGQHVEAGQRYGLTKQEIGWVTEGSGAQGWTEHDAAILRGVEEMLANQMITDETWATLAKTWDEPQRIEFPMAVGHYTATGIVQNVLRIRLEPGAKGLSYRG